MKEVDTLIFGIGNPARGDDGVGYEFVTRLKENGKYHLKHSYQLNIEDAELISHYKKIIFIDAAIDIREDLEVLNLVPKSATSFTTHSLDIPSVLSLCQEVYHRTPNTLLIKIKGSNFELGDRLSDPANRGLETALSRLPEII